MFERVKELIGGEVERRTYIQDCGECWDAKGKFKITNTGALVKKGKKLIHLVYRDVFGKRERGAQVWQECVNPHCVNPNHLTLIKKGETNPMGYLGREYWSRRAFFIRMGRIPGKHRKIIADKKILQFDNELFEQEFKLKMEDQNA